MAGVSFSLWKTIFFFFPFSFLDLMRMRNFSNGVGFPILVDMLIPLAQFLVFFFFELKMQFLTELTDLFY